MKYPSQIKSYLISENKIYQMANLVGNIYPQNLQIYIFYILNKNYFPLSLTYKPSNLEHVLTKIGRHIGGN